MSRLSLQHMSRLSLKMLLAPVAALLMLFGVMAPVSASEARVVAADPVAVPEALDVLSIGCTGAVRSGNHVAGCRWGQSDDARAYQLWRIVDRGDRELVGTFDNTVTVARDDVPDDAVLVRYAVIALGVDGEIVGRSRATSVRFRSHDRG